MASLGVREKTISNFWDDVDFHDTMKLFLTAFSRFQDFLGQLLTNFMRYIYDDISLLVLDALSLTRKHEILIADEVEWAEMREIRNTFSHIYPMTDVEILSNFKKAFNVVDLLIESFYRDVGFIKWNDELIPHDYVPERRPIEKRSTSLFHVKH